MGIIICEMKEKETSTFYKIVNKNTPNYLCTLIPPTIQHTSVYLLRNGNDISLPFCRLSSTSESFIPSTIKMWNSLNNNIRSVDTFSKVKFELKKIDETENHSVPKHFFLWSSKIKYYFNSAKKFSFVFEFLFISSWNRI